MLCYPSQSVCCRPTVFPSCANASALFCLSPFRAAFFPGKQDDRLHVPRDNGLNVRGTREHITSRCMGEQISLILGAAAGIAVPAALTGVHRNHHFDTIERLHPLLMHPLNTGNTPSSSGHWIRLLFILWRVAGWSFLSRKKRYQRAKVNISFFLL